MSNKRIHKFLNNEEIDENAVEKIPLDAEGNIIRINDASFQWSNSPADPIILKK